MTGTVMQRCFLDAMGKYICIYYQFATAKIEYRFEIGK